MNSEREKMIELTSKIMPALDGEKNSDIIPALIYLTSHSICEMSKHDVEQAAHIAKATFEMMAKMIAMNIAYEEETTLQ